MTRRWGGKAQCLLGIAAVLAAAVLASPAFAGEGKLEGYVQHRSEYAFREPTRYAVSEFTALMDFQYQYNEQWKARAILRGIYDGVYDFTDRADFHKAIAADRSLRTDGDMLVREVYVDYMPVNALKLRLGKQMLSWGETDGLRLMDMINPLDLRRGYLTRSFEDTRIPLWMLRADYDIPGMEASKTYFEFLWIDDFAINRIAPEGAAWAPANPIFIQQQFAILAGLGLVPVITDSPRAQNLQNSRFGAKLSSHVGGADVTLNFLHTFSDDAVFKFKGIGAGTFNLEQVYPWKNVFGLTANYDLGMAVLRTEIAYELNHTFQNVTMPDWTEKSDYLKAMVGFDYNLIIPGFNRDRSFFISGQAFDFHIMDHNNNIINIPYGYTIKEDEAILTLLVNTGFINDSIKPQMFVAYDAAYGGWWINPSIGYEHGTHWRFEVGANWFEGKHDRQRLPFSAFEGDSTAYAQIRRMF